jgi:hypothetical protein
MKSIKYSGIFIAIIIIILVLRFCNKGCFNRNLENKGFSIDGKIKRKYRDKKNHDMATVIFNDSTITRFFGDFIDDKGPYEAIQPGDSLVRAKGSLEYIIKKEDTVLYFYPHCVLIEGGKEAIGIIRNPNFDAFYKDYLEKHGKKK